jgi:undecaprenyl-diphosphatase
VTRFVQGLSDGAVGDIARFMNTLGQTPNMLLIGMATALICLVRRRPDTALLIVGAMLMRIANPFLKTIFASPRPSTGDGVRVEEIASGFGFPSGHVMGMTLFVGALAILAWDAVPQRRGRIVVVLGTGAVLFASGWGRIAVGAHWPSDVLGGYLFGGLGVSGLLMLRSVAPRLNVRLPEIGAPAFSPAEEVPVLVPVTSRRWRNGALALAGVMAIGVVWTVGVL